MQAWNGWVHCSGSTFGTWLRGDPKGWRSRRHREHCEGDYRNPPPEGAHKKKYEQSRRAMKRDGVELSKGARECACKMMVQALKFHGVEVVALCVGRTRYHALIKCPKIDRYGCDVYTQVKTHLEKSLGTAVPRLWRNRIARHFIGIAKKESARALSREKLAAPGGVFAAGCGVKPIKDRTHEIRCTKYIRNHIKEGAVVWLWFNPSE
jgi:hypothetical protein